MGRRKQRLLCKLWLERITNTYRYIFIWITHLYICLCICKYEKGKRGRRLGEKKGWLLSPRSFYTRRAFAVLKLRPGRKQRMQELAQPSHRERGQVRTVRSLFPLPVNWQYSCRDAYTPWPTTLSESPAHPPRVASTSRRLSNKYICTQL